MKKELVVSTGSSAGYRKGSNFIKLNKESGIEVLVNVDKIHAMVNYGNSTYIDVGSGDGDIVVRETIDEIFKMIRGESNG